MVRIIADEFLTEERDRKYYADHYTCCPPPLFILLITLIEVSTSHRRVTFIQPYPACGHL
jgi:rhomboid-related protein 1/2/3